MNKKGVSFAHAAFVKSSASTHCGECVEIAKTHGYVGVRDSKDQTGPVLVFSDSEWSAFLTGVERGEFN